MNVIDNLKELFGGARSAIAKLRQSIETINQKIAALQKERVDLFSMPAPWAEVQGNIKAVVRTLRDNWIAAHGLEAIRQLGGRAERHFGPGSEQLVPGRLPDALLGAWTAEQMAAVAPELLEEGMLHLFGAVEFEAGSPMATRFTRVKEIDAEIRNLEVELAKIHDEAQAAGISGIELPASIRGERIQKRQRLEAWEADRRANAKTYERHPELAPARPE